MITNLIKTNKRFTLSQPALRKFTNFVVVKTFMEKLFAYKSITKQIYALRQSTVNLEEKLMMSSMSFEFFSI